MTASELPARLRRCRHLMVELDERPRIALSEILAGRSGRISRTRWLARGGHLDQPVNVTLTQLALLEAAPVEGEIGLDALPAGWQEDDLRHLLDHHLLFDLDRPDAGSARDLGMRSLDWWTPAAITHAQGRWQGNDVAARWSRHGKPASAQMVAAFGPAPEPDRASTLAGEQEIALPMPAAGVLDSLLEQRRTSRRFDPQAVLPAAELGSVLYRFAACLGRRDLAPGAYALKKYAPAGGGLHATDLRLLLRRVDGLRCGLYHYNPFHHSVLLQQELEPAQAEVLAYHMLGGQDWFLAAPLLGVLVSRFDRLFWKYRNHSKALKVAHLDAGHLSQLMYLAAADRGLDAFVTAAVNDHEIEQALGLDPAREGVAAILGFGQRGNHGGVELDDWQPSPARQRWLDARRQSQSPEGEAQPARASTS